MEHKKLYVSALASVILIEPILANCLHEHEKIKQQHLPEKEAPLCIMNVPSSSISATAYGIQSIKYSQY